MLRGQLLRPGQAVGDQRVTQPRVLSPPTLPCQQPDPVQAGQVWGKGLSWTVGLVGSAVRAPGHPLEHPALQEAKPDPPRLVSHHTKTPWAPQILAAWGYVSAVACRGDETPPQPLSKQLFAQQPPWLRKAVSVCRVEQPSVYPPSQPHPTRHGIPHRGFAPAWHRWALQLGTAPGKELWK